MHELLRAFPPLNPAFDAAIVFDLLFHLHQEWRFQENKGQRLLFVDQSISKALSILWRLGAILSCVDTVVSN